MDYQNFPIEWQFHKGLFALYCAFGLLDHNDEYGAIVSEHPTFKIMCEFASKNNIKIKPELQIILSKGHPALYIVRVLRYDANFIAKGLKHSLEKSESWYGNFDKLLADFYFSNNLLSLETICLPYYEKIGFSYLKHSTALINKLNKNALINPKKYNLSKLILLPNPIDRTSNGYGPKIGSVAFVIFVPYKKESNIGVIAHEYLHSIINPLFESSEMVSFVKKTERLASKYVDMKVLKYYPKWEWILIEYIVRSYEILIKKDRIEYLQDEKEFGFREIELFTEAISSDPKFIEDLTNNLNKLIDKRDGAINKL